MKKHILVASALAGMMLTTAISSGYAADFTVNTGITDATSKMLSANNDIGTIQSGATLSTSASPAIIAGALNQRINNAGTIETTNTGNPAIMFAGNISTGTIITNGGIIRTTGGGAAHPFKSRHPPRASQ